MKRRWKIVASAAAVLAALGSLFVAMDGDRVFRVATSSISRPLCSAAFVSQVDPDVVLREEQLPESGMVLIA